MSGRILVVDDEPDVLKVVTFRLGKMGHQIFSAVTGEEALDMVAKEAIDLVFLDLRMPGIDGSEVCKRIKSDERLKSIPVILLSASNASAMSEIVDECKADGYLVKPFDVEDLIETVNRFIV
ncbi:MAG: response regulator [Candidatus Omnitrophica bacterium]|nr:response regulator [Candidatus Omnitrophota bacterium]